MLAFGASSAAAATTLTVSTTADTSASGGACGNTGITTAPSPLSLREAVCLANNLGGEVTINIPSGTYKLSNGELFAGLKPGQVEKFIGAGSALTTIDAEGRSRVFNVDNSTLGNIKSTFTGMSIINGSVTSVGGAGILDGAAGLHEPGDELTIENAVFKNNVTGKTLYNEPGGAIQMAGGKATIRNTLFTENEGGKSPGSAFTFLNEGGSAGEGALIVGSTFTNNTTKTATRTKTASTNPALAYGGAVYIKQTVGSSEITESVFRNNSSTTSSVNNPKEEEKADGAAGGAIDLQRGTLTVTRSTFTGNSVSSTGEGEATGAVVSMWSPNENTTLTMKYNRLVGNTPASTAVYRASGIGTGTLTVTDDWWGCNAGPGNAGCDGASGSVTTTPRLQFRASASPTTVVGPNGTSTLNANFATDSAGATISAANLFAFNGAPVTWSDPQPSPAKINGTAGSSTTNFSGGQATATYESSTASGTGHAVAAFDNASVTIPLTVDQEPVITGSPSSQEVTPGSTVTFSASASGNPTPSVQWERNTGSGWEAISGATSTTYSFTAQRSESGYQFRAKFTNTIEGTKHEATTTAATLTVGKAQTTLTSNATSTAIGGAIHDTATLSGGRSPGGTITFNVYGASDTTCSAAPLKTSAKRVAENGTFESESITPTEPGEYRWTVVYSGDANNEEAVGACNAANEKSTVSKATTSLSSTATGAAIGGAIHDTATLSGGYNPGGTITFKAYAPGDTSCSATTPAFTSSAIAVTKNGSYESGSFTPATAGEYRWTATYTGDGNNSGVTSACNAANEKSTVSKAIPTLSTVASQSTVDGSTIQDTATFGGGYNPGGTIVFKLFPLGDTNCSKTPLSTTTDNVTQNGTYQSASYGPPFQSGDYRWTAVYSGDANNVEVVDPCNAPNETSTVGKATTAISTVASNAVVGEAIHDTATISGGVGPGGTITFKAFEPGDTTCTTPIQAATSVVNVTKNGSYESASYTPKSTGDYRWTAEYSGDANNKPANSACNAAEETSKVSLASPTISTKATEATIGGKIHDTATIAGGQNARGTITFEAFGPEDATCGTKAAFAESVPVAGNGSYESPEFEPQAAGTYRWTAEYSGDSNNKAATSACNAPNESSTVAKAEPTISTAATDTTIGGEVHDTATIAAGVGPTGTITFRVFGPADTTCTATVVHSSIVTVTKNGSYESEAITPANAGDYRWTAEYSGDGNNKPAISACNAANETSSVAQVEPTISTKATSASLGNEVHDTAMIAGGFNPGGRITFEAFGPTDTTCSETAVESKTVQVGGNGSYGSPSFKPATIGVYRWVASYSGDVNNEAVVSPCNAPEEASTISKAVTSLGTNATNAAIGNPIHDTATLAGGQGATGTITFKVYGPNDATCAGPVAETLIANVSGNGTYGSGDYTPTQSGEYRWVASYSGDAENEGVSGACNATNEKSIVANAEPTLSTSATDTTIGGEIEDAATLAGGQGPGGTITFEAFGPGDERCEGAAVFTKTVQVSGNGEYASTAFTPEPAGDYHWIASYSGDGNNTPAEGQCGDEGETSTVAQAAPTLSSTATDATLGGAVHATATLAGGHLAGGTLTFTAYGPNDSACTGKEAFSATVKVEGSGGYGSGDFTPTAAGSYRWTVAYSGDADNKAVKAACGEAGTSSVAEPAKTSIGDNPPAKPIVPCLPSAPPTAGGYVPKTTVKTGLVPGVRAKIHVGQPSNLSIAAMLKYRLNGKTRSVELGTSSMENPGTRNLRVAIPSALREVLPLGTKVHLALAISATPVGTNPCDASAKQSKLTFTTKVVKVLLAQ